MTVFTVVSRCSERTVIVSVNGGELHQSLRVLEETYTVTTN